MPDDIVVDEAKFNRLLKKMIETEPIHYKEVLEKPKLRRDGKPKQSGRKVRKPDKNS
ncbi:MAG: hypothetical protein ABSE82_13385 [Nitrososphaerales archaeon]|jgi:hypothetical protein